MGKGGRKVAAAVDELVVLRSQDGMDFVVPAKEAALSLFVHRRLMLYPDKHIVPAHGNGDDTTKSKYTPILLRSVRGKTLAKVLEYCKKHADPAWYANVASLDHETLCDLILAAHSLSNRGLLALTCHVVANMVKGKSVDEIFKLFNLDQDRALTWEQNALNALHIVRCQDFTAYDPKRHDFICTRLAQDNIAFFDPDKESRIARGPPLDSITGSILDWGVQSSLNIISVKVTESDVGYPLSVFGTVLARDEVDYKCIYLFRREKEDAQIINSMVYPPRGLVLLDEVYFEIDLKIKHGGKTVDFSKGVVSLLRGRLHADKQTMTVNLCSWLSSVDVACEHVVHPVEATVEITILKGYNPN